MSGVAGLVDTLLAAKLSQRLDLLRWPPASAVAQPDPAPRVAPARNDVTLPSQAAADSHMSSAPEARAPAAASSGSGASLSAAGRAISSLLAALPVDPGPVRGRAALESVPPQGSNTAPLARALAGAVATSGLFYESHLAAVDRGLLAPAELAKEPQARWPLAAEARVPSPPVGERAAATALVAPEAQTLVTQQLELLASGVFRWTGEAWPAILMDWSIRQDEAQCSPELKQPHAGWTTDVALTLPQLGRVEVRLTLLGPAVSARIVAGPPATGCLRGALRDLRAQLARAGLNVSTLSIQDRGDEQ